MQEAPATAAAAREASPPRAMGDAKAEQESLGIAEGENLEAAASRHRDALEAGMHRIEIRSGSRKPYLTYMVVQAGEQRRIRHDFGATPSRPPT